MLASLRIQALPLYYYKSFMIQLDKLTGHNNSINNNNISKPVAPKCIADINL